MEDIKNIVTSTLSSKKMCGFGVDEAQNASSIQDLIDLLKSPKGIEFCMQKGYPKLKHLEAYEEVLLQNDVIISGKHNFSNPRLILVYGGDVTIEVDGFNISEVYATNDAKVKVVAKDNAYVAIESYNQSEVVIEQLGSAKVFKK